MAFEIQQRLRRSSFSQVQRFHFANNDQVITCDMFGVNFAIKPVQAAFDSGITQWRFLPFDAVPFVRAFPSKLVRNFDLIT